MIATSYLRAIQKIPGDTAGEKMKWLGTLSQNQLKDQQKASGDVDQVPSELQPILRVEAAVKKKIHEDITSALKSEDVTIVRRAFQASWFFDGSHKDVVDAKYFREQIFPYVSMTTRLHIIKILVLRLKDPQFAQQMFTEVESIFGIQYALPLIVACDEKFAYRTIVDKKINLPFAIAKKMFRKNMDFIVRYLRLSDPSVKNSFRVNIRDYAAFLPTLLKKRLPAFVELYEMHEIYPPEIKLSNTCIDVFLKKGIDHLIRKPQLYIKILPLKKIHATVMEKIFPALMPENVQNFNMPNALKYLEYYPEAKKFDFLREAYRNKYGVEIFATLKNVTPEVLLLMPVEERAKQARIMITTELEKTDGDDNDKAFMVWICYLPIAESIPYIKRTINKTATLENRITLMQQIITSCKMNKDEDALIDFMKYFLDRHKNEEDRMYDRIVNKIASLYDLSHSSEKIWSTLNVIIDLFYVKYGRATETALVAQIHYRLFHDMPIAKQIDMLIESQKKVGSYVNFTRVFPEHLHYRRRFLVICIETLEQNCIERKWGENITHHVLANLVIEMYDFNKRCDKEKNAQGSSTEIERMTIKDYPWLQRFVYQYLIQVENGYGYLIKDLFYKYELELYRSWFHKEETWYVDKVRIGDALKSLKQNPQTILKDWEKYFEVCKTYSYRKSVQRFVRAIRWYNDLPIWFVERCQEKWQKDYNYLVIMALLLHGDTIAKIVEPLILTEMLDIKCEDAKNDYMNLKILPLVMKVSNPLVPLELIAKFCEGDYLTIALMVLTYACRQSPLPKVMSFAENLTNKRVGVSKHGIRIMYMVAPTQQLQRFLLSCWQKKQHHSLRTVLFKSIQDLFFKNPNEHNWSLYKYLISTISVADDLLIPELNLPRVPAEYIVDYIELLFDVIHKLLEQGLLITKVLQCIITMLGMITEQICDNLKDSFITMLLQKYLFNQNEQLSNAAINFIISPYLLTAKGMCYTRMNTFSDIFKKEVKERWDKSHPKKSSMYPMNYTVHSFINNFVIRALVKENFEPDVITKMLETFSSVLTPQMEPLSYLLLVYAHELTKSTSPKQFGLQLGTRMPDLIKTFSPMFVSFMSDILNNLPLNIFNKKLQNFEVTHDIVEGLIEANNMESCFIAANFLLKDVPSRSARHHILVKRLMDINHPGVTSLLNHRKNQISYRQADFDVDN